MASWKGIPCLTFCPFHCLGSLILSSFTFLWRNFNHTSSEICPPCLYFSTSYDLPPIFSLHLLPFIFRVQKHFPLLFLLSQPELYLCHLYCLKFPPTTSSSLSVADADDFPPCLRARGLCLLFLLVFHICLGDTVLSCLHFPFIFVEILSNSHEFQWHSLTHHSLVHSLSEYYWEPTNFKVLGWVFGRQKLKTQSLPLKSSKSSGERGE